MGNNMKKTFFLLFLVSAVFAAVPCPDGCECISEIDFLAKYGWMPTPDDYCEGIFVECDFTPTGVPLFCFAIPPEAIGSGEVERGPNSPRDHEWHYDPESDDIWNEMLQLKITAGEEEDITIRSITMRAFGTGNDSKDILRIEIHVDLDHDGIVDDTDVLIATADPAYSADNGTRKIGLDFNMAREAVRYIIISYIMAADAPVGETYGFAVENITAKGRDTGITFELEGLPVNSSIKTIIERPVPPPVCTGNLTLELRPDEVEPEDSVDAGVGGLRNCTNKTVQIFPEPCDFLTAEMPECSCVVDETGSCSCVFDAPPEDGDYTYYACADRNDDRVVDEGESAQDNLTVEEVREEPPEETRENLTVEGGPEEEVGEGAPENVTEEPSVPSPLDDTLTLIQETIRHFWWLLILLLLIIGYILFRGRELEKYKPEKEE